MSLAQQEIHPVERRKAVGSGAGAGARADIGAETGGLQTPSTGFQEEGGRRRSVSRNRSRGEERVTSVGEGRRAIKGMTMNLAGQSVMGITPAYKINYIKYAVKYAIQR